MAQAKESSMSDIGVYAEYAQDQQALDEIDPDERTAIPYPPGATLSEGGARGQMWMYPSTKWRVPPSTDTSDGGAAPDPAADRVVKEFGRWLVKDDSQGVWPPAGTIQHYNNGITVHATDADGNAISGAQWNELATSYIEIRWQTPGTADELQTFELDTGTVTASKNGTMRIVSKDGSLDGDTAHDDKGLDWKSGQEVRIYTLEAPDAGQP
jgi:hypothetical protein